MYLLRSGRWPPLEPCRWLPFGWLLLQVLGFCCEAAGNILVWISSLSAGRDLGGLCSSLGGIWEGCAHPSDRLDFKLKCFTFWACAINPQQQRIPRPYPENSPTHTRLFHFPLACFISHLPVSFPPCLFHFPLACFISHLPALGAQAGRDKTAFGQVGNVQQASGESHIRGFRLLVEGATFRYVLQSAKRLGGNAEQTTFRMWVGVAGGWGLPDLTSNLGGRMLSKRNVGGSATSKEDVVG
jgi:hypothetical protein